jgi:phosphinothricin acetyltransferase
MNPPNQPIIRPATENDLPGILHIYNDVILNTTAVYQYQPHTLQMRHEWFDKMKADGYPVFVAEVEKEIAGFSYYASFRTPAAYKYTVENTVHVHPAYRGRGIAKLLMQPVIESAKQMQMHTMVAGIDATNVASIKLHQHFGFKEVACFKQVGFKFGQWLDLVFMQLILDNNER